MLNYAALLSADYSIYKAFGMWNLQRAERSADGRIWWTTIYQGSADDINWYLGL